METTAETPLLDRIEEVFGTQGFPDALFYQFENALRFELGGEATHVERFLQGVNRTREVAELAFADSRNLTLVARFFSLSEAPRFPRSSATRFRDANFLQKFSKPETVLEDEYEGERSYSAWSGADFDLNSGALATVIWSALSHGWKFTKGPAVRVYLVDFDRGLVMFPYDDRGMDLICISPTPLIGVYRQFGAWLLDYDRARMDAVFAG